MCHIEGKQSYRGCQVWVKIVYVVEADEESARPPILQITKANVDVKGEVAYTNSGATNCCSHLGNCSEGFSKH